MVLLVNILDSLMNYSPVREDYNRTPTPRAEDVVYEKVRATIIRIFEIVRLFGEDHDRFWSFLQVVGCITDNTDEKGRQELSYPSARLGDEPRFRVYGRLCAYKTGDVSHETLQDLKSVQVVCHVESGT